MSKMQSTAETDIEYFKQQLQTYKTLIDEDIADYAKRIQAMTLREYGKNARLEIDAFLDVLLAGGKRIRGALVMLGYEMSGGKNQTMIVQAARAIEMLHAYLLIIDDIQDRSTIRRGRPAAHVALAEHHEEQGWANSSEHFGASIALNAAFAGSHAAQMILANLDIDEEARLKTISIVNRTLMVTAHGQTNDIVNEVVADVSEADIDRVLEWKTAHYTFLNPLHVGMVLAGAGCRETDAITDYAVHAGKAFQITDDIVGVFGSEFTSGKSPMDDIREGKRTLLTMYALEHTDTADKNFLIQMLGKSNLTPAEFNRCKDILVDSGALAYSQAQAKKYVTVALQSIETSTEWTHSGVRFLRGLTQYLLIRQS